MESHSSPSVRGSTASYTMRPRPQKIIGEMTNEPSPVAKYDVRIGIGADSPCHSIAPCWDCKKGCKHGFRTEEGAGPATFNLSGMTASSKPKAGRQDWGMRSKLHSAPSKRNAGLQYVEWQGAGTPGPGAYRVAYTRSGHHLMASLNPRVMRWC